jgi:hypothetical protein
LGSLCCAVLLRGEASFASVAAAVCVVRSREELGWRRIGFFPLFFFLLFLFLALYVEALMISLEEKYCKQVKQD